MTKVIIMQIRKVFARADVKTSTVVFFLIPILVAFLISRKSDIIQIGDSVFSAMGYASVIIGLLKSVFLIGAIVAFISTTIISKEIDSGLDCVYFTKLKKQEYLFVSKSFAMVLFVTCTFLSIIIASIAGWGIFLCNTEFGSTVFLAEEKDEAVLLVFSILSAYLEMITICGLCCLISLLYKYSKAIVINLAVIVVMRILSGVSILQRWLPSAIGDATALFRLTGRDLVFRGLEGIMVLGVYTITLFTVGVLMYKKMDLVR